MWQARDEDEDEGENEEEESKRRKEERRDMRVLLLLGRRDSGRRRARRTRCPRCWLTQCDSSTNSRSACVGNNKIGALIEVEQKSCPAFGV